MTLRDHEDSRSTVLLTVGGDPTQEARRTIGKVAELRSLPDVRFTAQLLTGELVSNVVRHAGLSSEERFQLDTVCDEHMLRVAVVDGGLGCDPLAVLGDHAALSAGHRGIALIDVLADRWGYRRGPGELEVWFEIDLVPGRRPWIGRERIPQPPPEAG